MRDEQLRKAQRAAGAAAAAPAARAALYREELRSGRQAPPLVAGCWLEQVVAHSGMGVVYRVLHEGSGTEQMLKLHPAQMNARSLRRLQRAADLRQRLEHPAIPAVYETGTAESAAEPEGEVFFVREAWLGGRSWFEVLRADGPPAWRVAVEAAREIAEGLAHAHAAGVLHLAITTQRLHLRLEARPSAWLSGWSYARPVPESPPRALVRDSYAIGAPYFVAPELLLGQPPGGAADVYSLTACLYRLLTGQLPFQGATSLELIRQATAGHFPALDVEAAGLPPDLGWLVSRGGGPVEQRPTAEGLAAGLGAILEGSPLPETVRPSARGWLRTTLGRLWGS